MTGRGLHGRQIARVILLVALFLPALLAFLYITQPHYMGPMFAGPTNAWIGWIGGVGALGYAVGLAWMIRIYRATLDAESRPSSWRSGSR